MSPTRRTTSYILGCDRRRWVQGVPFYRRLVRGGSLRYPERSVAGWAKPTEARRTESSRRYRAGA
jgi:hypothetical protein